MKTDGQILVEFCDKLFANQEELPPEFRKVIDDHFWELVDEPCGTKRAPDLTTISEGKNESTD